MPVNYLLNGQFNAFSLSCARARSASPCTIHRFVTFVSGLSQGKKKAVSQGREKKQYRYWSKTPPHLTTLTSRLPQSRQIVMLHRTPHFCFSSVVTWLDHGNALLQVNVLGAAGRYRGSWTPKAALAKRLVLQSLHLLVLDITTVLVLLLALLGVQETLTDKGWFQGSFLCSAPAAARCCLVCARKRT